MKQQFEADMQEYNSNKNKDSTTGKPQKSPQKMLFIPANNSATGFLEILGDSDKRGLIFETEGDTLAKAFKSDYGDFSDGFRNAFQHEPISYYRRTDKEYVEIDRPCLSALLSGTPKQIQTLYIAIQEEDIISSVRRLGLTAYRMMMIFSGLRILETGEIEKEIYYDDTDFENTLQLITVLTKHSSYVYTQIAQEAYKPKPKHKKEKFLDSLPAQFNRQTYVAIALSLGITDKSSQRYIKEFVVADILQDDGHDKYINSNATNPHFPTYSNRIVKLSPY